MTSPHDNGATDRVLIKAAYDRDCEKAASFPSTDIEAVDEATGQRLQGRESLRQVVQYWLGT